MARFFILCILSLSISQMIYAINIRGVIKEKESGSPLPGSTVIIKNTTKGVVSDEQGNFIFTGLPAGEYILECSFIGYTPVQKKITLSGKKEYTLIFELEEASTMINTVTVTGKANIETDASARITEKLSANVMNIISANTIEVSPDITVAAVAQRMPGVSITRNAAGEATHAIIRGMEPRYSYTTVNGVKIPSPDEKNRYIPLNIFPADLLGRLEVTKALTPSQEGDAIGGAVNMVLKDAPTRQTIKINASTGYNQEMLNRKFLSYDKHAVEAQSPYEKYGNNYSAVNSDFSYANLDFREKQAPPNFSVNGSYGNSFFENKLGVIVAASFLNDYKGTNSIFIPQGSAPELNNEPNLVHFYERHYSTQQQRSGIHAKINYNINPEHKISLYNAWMRLNDYQARYTVDTVLTGSRTGPGTGAVNIYRRSRTKRQQINATMLQGEHTSLPVGIRWDATYSVAKGALPDWAELSTGAGNITDASGNLTNHIETVNQLSRIWIHNKERDINLSLDLDYKFSFLGVSTTAFIGGLYRNKKRDNFYVDYQFECQTSQPEVFTSIYDVKFISQGKEQPVNPKGTATGANNYTATENISSGYAQLRFEKGKSMLLGGVRIEKTGQHILSEINEEMSFGKEITKNYINILPSIHYKYTFNDHSNLRLSYFTGITRPALYEVSLYEINYEDYNVIGNPFLRPTTANNIDIRYELYGRKNDYLLIGAFFKRIVDPIEIGLFNGNDTILPVGNIPPYDYTLALKQTEQPCNFGTAINYGVEVVFEKFFNKIGLSGNYTFTMSEITQDKKLVQRDMNGSIETTTLKEKRPLQGQSRHIANLSLIYKEDKIGLDARISMVYTGKLLYAVSGWYGMDYWQKGMTLLDLSVEETIKKWTIFFKVNNLLNTPKIVELNKENKEYDSGFIPGQTSRDKITVQKSYFYQSYTLGLRYNF